MSWLSKTLTSSIGRKFVMSLTGLFLVTFLIEHLIGNLLLLKSDGGVAFNEFAHFMKYNPLIRVGEVVLFGGILFHAIDGIILIRKNKSARRVSYVHSNESTVDNKLSKYMGPFGVIILVFMVIHLSDFFYYKYWGEGVVMNMPGTDIADLAVLVYKKFTQPIYVVIYTVSMLVVSFHLKHGFQSAFQTLGLNHQKYTPFIKFIGNLYAIVVPLGLAIIPILIFLWSMN